MCTLESLSVCIYPSLNVSFWRRILTVITFGEVIAVHVISRLILCHAVVPRLSGLYGRKDGPD
jgi:hypothetical protein